ncbi:MAG: autotransporter-associated beta strand repeat-containing protein, partial [Planctomycetales bacterium]|nr:autotransporter-associated beta strand repeat-containing protein [Planctomycetales bacterium]
AASTATLSGATSGAGALSKTGAGTLNITGPSTLTGGANVNGGTLRLSAPAGFDTGVFAGAQTITVASGAQLDVAGNWNVGSANTLTVNSGNVNISNGSATDGVNYINNLNLNSGASVTGNPFRSGFASNSLFTVGGAAASTISASMYLVNDVNVTGVRQLTLNVGDVAAGTDLFFSGVIRDLGQNGTGPSLTGMDIVKTGAGTAEFSGANTYAGDTTISQGTLRTTNSSALGTGTLIMNGGTLNTSVDLANNITLNNPTNTIEADGNYRILSGQISGPGGFTVANGGGTPGLMLTNSANNFGGDVVINGGTYLRLGASEVLPNTASVQVNGNLRMDVPGGGTETIAGLTGNGSIWVPTSNNTTQTLVVGAGNASSTFSGTIGQVGQNNNFLALTKIGSGTLTLANTGNQYKGKLTINDGTISVAQLAGGNTPSALGAFVGTSAFFEFNGGTLEYTGGTVGGINRAFLLSAGGGTIDVTNAATTLTWTDASGAGPITGPGHFTKEGAGTLEFAGSNNYTGGTTISQGTLRTTNTNALGTGTLILDGGTLNTSVDLANNITLNQPTNTIAPDGNYRILSGQISGPGGLTVANGGGTPGLMLTNSANNFGGDVTIDAGTYLRLGASEVLPNTANVQVNGNLRMDVPGGGTETISGLTGTGSIWTPIGNNATQTLVVGAGNASSTFSGTIGEAGQNNNFLALTKIGSGTLTLANT